MDQTELLLEYLKEQYTQARQHENRQTSATTFLTTVAAAVLGFALKDGELHSGTWWICALVVLIGLANLLINEAHFTGNRYHTAAAGETRRALEAAIPTWTVKKPTEIRSDILAKFGLKGPDVGIGMKVNARLRLVPIGVMIAGFIVGIAAFYVRHCGAN